MNAIRVGLIVTLFWALLPENTHAQSPRAVVELAFVSRASEQKPKVPLQEELDAKLESSEATDEGLRAFFDAWLTGKDHKQSKVDTIQMKVPWNEEVEFSVQNSPLPEFADVELPHVRKPVAGVTVTVRATRLDDGKIKLKCRPVSRTLASPQDWEVKDGATVPTVRTYWIDTALELEPGKASTVGALNLAIVSDGKQFDYERLMVIRIEEAEPASFPLD